MRITMSNRIFFHRKPSPVGPLLLLSDGTALVGLFTPGDGESRPVPPGATYDPSPFRDVSAQLDRYFAGELRNFDVHLRLSGTPFQRSVWAELVAIPCGTTISYRELAMRIENPRAVRAVGGANGKNPVSIIVPCHRVVGADGDLVGYGGGLPSKRWLLAHERALAPAGSRQTLSYGSWAARETAVAR
jgi:methylated-DNA-[protein]-cysteine S-methyltransferase